MKNLIIAIDGHSSCGKSTMAKALANHFNFRYIDTGAMYRATTLFAIRNSLITEKSILNEELKKASEEGKIDINFRYNKELKRSDTFLNNENVENEIRNIEVSQFVSKIAELKFVRENLVAQQQKMGEEGGIIMDGRDIGTVVFPNAEVKIFLTAQAKIRAERRFKELTEKGENVTFEEIFNNVEMRDKIDSTRTESPLIQAKDAILIDNSFLTPNQQNEIVIELINKKLKTNEN